MMKGTSGVSAPLNNVIMVVAILGLVATQTFVEAQTVDCRKPPADHCYGECIRTHYTGSCAEACGCTFTLSTTTPNDINRFCKLGCESSVCSAISTLQASAGNVGEEAVKEEVERCNNKCSDICSKGFDDVVA